MTLSVRACAACGGTDWKPLPGWHDTAMLSDGRCIAKPMEKEHCFSCGLARHIVQPSPEEIEHIFEDGYELFTRLTGSPYEDQRQSLYATWILSMLQGRRLDSMFEVGSGAGGLMAQLKQRLPGVQISGVEPVQSAIETRLGDLNIRRGLLREIDRASINADVVLSVNVIEHVEDPIEFLRQSAEAAGPDGCVVVACPDGDTPSSELLLYDHFHSLTAQAISLMAGRAGLKVVKLEKAPAALGPFHAVVLERGTAEQPTETQPGDELYEGRRQFLAAWHSLDEKLLAMRTGIGGELWAFGSGENAQLLRAYAPRTWGQVGGILADTPGHFDGLEVVPYAPPTGEQRAVLLAVKPESQARLATRLVDNGDRPLRWDGFV